VAFETAQAQKDEVLIAQKQIADGLGIPSDQADREIKERLKK